MNKIFLNAKLILVMVARGCGRDVVNASKQAGARGGTKLLGQEPVKVKSAKKTEIEYREQDVVLILVQDQTEDIFNAIIEGSLDKKTGYSGTALILDVPKMFMRAGGGCINENIDMESYTSGGNIMQPGFTMIYSIINHGQAEELMAVAREAGAKGGTILNARGTGTQEDITFFGIGFAPEKELLIIITENTWADAILEALSSQPVFSEPGGGIIFTTAADRLITLGS